ncbi:MAG: PorV/PorQ family protein [Bacteroidetes bacterium]|nr:PorV/PorQ family protein [Bacteroidota bacterium]
MKRLKLSCVSILILICMLVTSADGQIKWAQTGFGFLDVTSDARAGAMGGAVNSLCEFEGALSYNPATMADITSLVNASVSVNSWIAEIQYLESSVIIAPASGKYGVIGLGIQSVDYGDLQGTMVWNNPDGYIDTGVFSPSALAVGIGYAYMISTQFGVGGQARFAYQSLGKSVISTETGLVTKQNRANAIAFDFGTIYKTGVKSLVFGVSVRNFSKEITYEVESLQLPLLFTIGISANVFDFISPGGPEQSLIVSIDATHPRSHPEQLKIGMEYELLKVISLRAGYTSNNSEDSFTYGLGVSTQGLGISPAVGFDYSYTPFGVFGNVQRFTARFSM